MNILVAGGAGFIGSHLCDRFICEGHDVICADKLVFGHKDNIAHLLNHKTFSFVQADLSLDNLVDDIFEKNRIDAVYHLAANSDIQKGGSEPIIDFHDTFLTTRNILESMRKYEVSKLFFASTSAVYGETGDQALTEDTGGMTPVSYYGGAKLAAEAFIHCYTAMNNMQSVVFRFPNVIGSRLTHGVIFDFIKKLTHDSTRLEILGDGLQCKPYIHVSDLVNAIMKCTREWKHGTQLYNISVIGEGTTVKRIAEIVTEVMNLKHVTFSYTGGKKGWKGDVPRFVYDITKVLCTGWRPCYTSDEAVRKTVEEVKVSQIQIGKEIKV